MPLPTGSRSMRAVSLLLAASTLAGWVGAAADPAATRLFPLAGERASAPEDELR